MERQQEQNKKRTGQCCYKSATKAEQKQRNDNVSIKVKQEKTKAGIFKAGKDIKFYHPKINYEYQSQ
jgi:hypothetical protein